MADQAIPGIPAATTGADLVAAVNDRIRRINLALGQAGGDTATTVTKLIVAGGGAAPAGNVNYGTHAQRLAAPVSAFPDGAEWYETDRTVTYQFQAGGVSAGSWRWIGGTYASAQASLPTDLGAGDAGFLAFVNDYNHTLAWSGSAWTAGPNWDAPGYIRGFMVDPSPTTGWKLCDGNGDDGSAIGASHPVKYLTSAGALVSITSATVAPCVPNLVSSPAFLEFGATASGINSAVAPTLTMNSYTPAGTVAAPALTMNSYTPAGTVAAPALTMNSYTPAGTVAAITATGTAAIGVPAGTAIANAAAETHTHTAPGYTGTPAVLTGTNSAPGYTGTPAVLTGTNSAPGYTGTPAVLTGTISAVLAPAGVVLRPWFRK